MHPSLPLEGYLCKETPTETFILVLITLPPSPAEQNYDIYDRELLAVIQALKEWHHYLTGTEHPVTIITDHKNLEYFKQPQNLSRWQARWWLFLQEYDI